MRVAIDGRSMQDKFWRGVGNYTYNLLRAIFELDRENEYYILYNAFGKLNVPEFQEYKNVHIYRYKWPNKLLKVFLVLFNRPRLDSKIKPDIFFAPNINFCAFSPITKVVSVAHDLYFEHFPEYAKLKIRLWHRFANPKQLLRRSTRIIAISEHTKADVIETYNIPQEKITVIYPGVNVIGYSQLAISDQKSNIQYPIANSKYILYFGALEPRKNIKGIIKAYELLKNPPNLVLAGCSSSYVAKLKKKLSKSKHRDKIRLVENPDEQNKKELYAGAKLFVYPSFYEGFGFPPLEAMSAGVPVVASSTSSVPEVCGNAAVLVNPFNINEIKQGMEILLEDGAMREKYIQVGYERAKQFSWQKCAEQVMKVFYDVQH